MDEQVKDYYEILTVDRLASTDQIKRAYKKLAIMHHPDKNLNNKQQSIRIFRQISQAYEVLVDSEKRKNYDIYGLTASMKASNSKCNYKDAQNIFKKFFETYNYGSNMEEDQLSQNSSANTKSTGSAFSSSFNNSFGFSSPVHHSQYIQKNKKKQQVNHLIDIGGEGISKSISTSTKTVNGKTVTIRRTTVKKKDGTKDVTEETIDGGTVVQKIYSLGASQRFGNKAVNYK